MATFDKVPVVDIHCENISIIWPSLLLAVRSSHFVGIDLELSGLGNRRKLVARCMDERYKFISEVAKTRSILAIGLSCFKTTCASSTGVPSTGVPSTGVSSIGASESTGEHDIQFQVQTFNLTTLCDEEYVVEPDALQFLVNHGFDFNKQYSKGMHYSRGVDKKTKASNHNVRQLVQELIAAKKPVVFHNGLVDLVFLYQNLYCPLPANYLSFIADISEMFPGGIYDTKYIAEYKYVFRKSQRENAILSFSGQKCVKISFCSYPEGAEFVEYRRCELPANLNETNSKTDNQPTVEYCKQYGSHGWCSRGITCPYSHDPDVILDNEHLQQHKRKRKRNRKRKRSGNNIDDGNTESSMSVVDDKHSMDTNEEANEEKTDERKKSDSPPINAEHSIQMNEETNEKRSNEKKENVIKTETEISVESRSTIDIKEGTLDNKHTNEPAKAGKHRAGFDAFMTGFTLATFIVKYGSWKHMPDSEISLGTRFKIEDLTNRLYLSGKPVPLLVEKSHFSKTSIHHREKIQKVCPPKFKHVTQVVLEAKGIFESF